MNRLSLKTKLGVGFGGLMIVLLAMGFVAYHSVGRMSEISAQVAHNLEEMDTASQIEAGVEKQSTGVRGFLLTGQTTFLDPYKEASKDIIPAANG